MAQAQTDKQNSRGTYDFTPIDCDVNTIEPDAAEGTYVAVIDDCRVQATSKDRYPMLVVDWRLDSAESETEEAERSVGATVADFFAFFPDGDRRGNFPKRRFRQLRELLDISDDALPTRLENKDDFKPLIAELKGKELTIYITLKRNPETNEDRAQISYTAPRGGMGALPAADDDKPAKKSAGKSNSGKKPAGKSRR